MHSLASHAPAAKGRGASLARQLKTTNVILQISHIIMRVGTAMNEQVDNYADCEYGIKHHPIFAST